MPFYFPFEVIHLPAADINLIPREGKGTIIIIIYMFSICERHSKDKIKFVQRWRRVNVNNENQEGYRDMYCSIHLGRRDQNLERFTQRTSIQDKRQTQQTVLQDFTRFSGTIREQQTASHFVFTRSIYACRLRNAWLKLNGGCWNMARSASVRIVNW